MLSVCFCRQLDGLLRMEVLITSLNHLRVVSPCKIFLRFYDSISGIFTFFRRICWPFTFDQPVTTSHVAENLNVAFELFQVRTGRGLKGPVARNGLAPEGTRHAVGTEIRQIIDLCRSEKGQELRSNAEKFKVKVKKTWEEDGAAREEVRNFLLKYTT
jgi:hypothetical protein